MENKRGPAAKILTAIAEECRNIIRLCQDEMDLQAEDQSEEANPGYLNMIDDMPEKIKRQIGEKLKDIFERNR